MPPIKEIRKLSKEIKEIPKKVESIDDEFEDDIEDVQQNTSFSIRRSNKTSTLEASGEKQDTFESREQNRTATNDRDTRSTVNFYAGGSGANPYKSNAYTPVGSAESGGNKRDLGERDLGDNRATRDNSMNNQDNPERTYAGEQDQGDRKDRKRNLM